ncbi:jg2597 [Pararge aegeria aegeria]|uniref:Jg2597 protein n=1 Tax=Pararge aegeria aegeria TaxID=348720 RepID=A0A8S4RZ61_9NEOP|nr:jg2597 [Pararge aegeria aegeria]
MTSSSTVGRFSNVKCGPVNTANVRISRQARMFTAVDNGLSAREIRGMHKDNKRARALNVCAAACDSDTRGNGSRNELKLTILICVLVELSAVLSGFAHSCAIVGNAEPRVKDI